jgi:hypothetical protein
MFKEVSMSEDKKSKRPVGRPLFTEEIANQRLVTYVDRFEKKELEILAKEGSIKDSNNKPIKSVSKLIRFTIQELIKNK